MTDKEYLTKDQYASSTRLNARIKIHEQFTVSDEKWHDFVFRYLLVNPGDKIFALGCGNATQWRANVAKFCDGVNIILSDFSFGMLSEAFYDLRSNSKFEFCVCDAQYIPFPENSLDFVTANHMIYHVPSIERTLYEINRVIKQTGIFMGATNGENHMQELYDLIHEFEPDYLVDQEKHRRFSLENGEKLIKKEFEYANIIKYNSHLWVTQSKPLVDYVFSMWDTNRAISLSKRPDLLNFFQKLIDRDGGIFINKSSGIFLATQSEEKHALINRLKTQQ